MANVIFPRTRVPSLSAGDITVSAGGFSSATIESEWVEVTASGATAIPNSNGAFKVEVVNVGGTVDGTDFAAISVNGDTVEPGGVWESQSHLDYTTSPPTQYFTGTVTVTNAAGSAFRYRVTRKP